MCLVSLAPTTLRTSLPSQSEKRRGERADYGGMHYDPNDGFCEYFEGKVPPKLFDSLSNKRRRKQIFGQVESMPCLAVREIWRARLRGRLVAHFVNNDACRFAFIKGSSPAKASAWLASQFWGLEISNEVITWFERVPSPGNPADAPSRGAALVSWCPWVQPVRVSLPSRFEQRLVEDWRVCAWW